MLSRHLKSCLRVPNQWSNGGVSNRKLSGCMPVLHQQSTSSVTWNCKQFEQDSGHFSLVEPENRSSNFDAPRQIQVGPLLVKNNGGSITFSRRSTSARPGALNMAAIRHVSTQQHLTNLGVGLIFLLLFTM